MPSTLANYKIEIGLDPDTLIIQVEARSSQAAIAKAWKLHPKALSVKVVGFEVISLDVILRRKGATMLPGFEEF